MQELLWGLHQYFIYPILTLLFFAILAYVVMGWLFVGGIIQPYNPTARSIWTFLQSIVEPLARPIRRVVPPLGQLDLSIMVLVLLIIFTRDFAIPRAIMALPGNV